MGKNMVRELLAASLLTGKDKNQLKGPLEAQNLINLRSLIRNFKSLLEDKMIISIRSKV